MKKGIILLSIIVLFNNFVLFFLLSHQPQKAVVQQHQKISIPIVREEPLTDQNPLPIPQRGEKYRRYLSATVKIEVEQGMGSGTIINYNDTSKEAYVASCGHLFSVRGKQVILGSASRADLEARPRYCNIVVWYKNNEKLQSIQKYRGRLLFYNVTGQGYDFSLISFKPDWEPQYFKIAPSNYVLNPGVKLHSMGCDFNTEVAHYTVEVAQTNGYTIITRFDGPRPGRSGGGVITEDGLYVGVCSATSDPKHGSGNGFFTGIRGLHEVYRVNGFDWLLR